MRRILLSYPPGVAALSLLFIFAFQLGCDGKAKDLAKGTNLGDPVTDGGGTRTDGSDFGQIYPVTTIISATADWSGVPFGDMISSRPVQNFDNTAQNAQWPFEFKFTYPANNYKLGEAHLVLVASRDATDTEGIYIGNGSTNIGVLSGRPPGGDMKASPYATYRFYECVGACSGPAPTSPYNRYAMDFGLTHYKIATENSFDFNLAALVNAGTLGTYTGTLGMSVLDVVKDGHVRANLFDDLAVLANGANNLASPPLLFLDGFTVSKTALSCATSPTYKFVNTYIHNDGSSLGTLNVSLNTGSSNGTSNVSAFTGTVYTPYRSYGTMGTAGNAVEFYFDPKLPRISSLNDLDLTAARIIMQIQRGSTGLSAIVINGIGISEAGFDRSTATSIVESWDDTSSTNTAFTAFLNTIPTTGVATLGTLNLINLLGTQSRVKTLLGQGKFNVAIKGALAKVYGANNTTARTYGTAVNGPELYLQGNYNTQICTVPNDPSSPLNDSSPTVGNCSLDQTSPNVSSIQAASITATSASIQWLSNENSDSQVAYGLTGPTTLTTLATANVSFHSVQLTGLQPYKYYQYTVKSKDACGNATTSSIKTFRTLR